MHTLYCSASIRNTCFSNVSFIHQIFSCPMTPNWWQLQLVVNQSETSQKPLQSYFSSNCFTVIPFHAYHLSSTPAYWACSILQYTSKFLTAWFSFRDPAGCKWHNSKQWRHILLLNLPSGLTGPNGLWLTFSHNMLELVLCRYFYMFQFLFYFDLTWQWGTAKINLLTGHAV